MINENPYAPPICEETLAEPEWPAGGAFRDGVYLVLHSGSPFPAQCVRTGLIANAVCHMELQCLGADDYSVPAKSSTFWNGTWYELQVPVHADWLRRQRTALQWARFILLAGFVALIFGLLSAFFNATLGIAFSSYLAFVSVILGVLLLGMGSVIQDSWRPLRSIYTIARGYVWLSGAPANYLQSFPPWPIPRTHFRRAWFGK